MTIDTADQSYSVIIMGWATRDLACMMADALSRGLPDGLVIIVRNDITEHAQQVYPGDGRGKP